VRAFCIAKRPFGLSVTPPLALTSSLLKRDATNPHKHATKTVVGVTESETLSYIIIWKIHKSFVILHPKTYDTDKFKLQNINIPKVYENQKTA
jgi:hypothetical protein